MPWCDNSSRWSMGLTKRVDYNGRIKQLKPEWVVSANEGGPGIVTRKIALRGSSDDTFTPEEMPSNGLPFSEKDYANPGDPITYTTTSGSGTLKFQRVQTKQFDMQWQVNGEMISLF